MSAPGREARVARGRGSRVADFARGRGSRGAGRRPPATLPTLLRSSLRTALHSPSFSLTGLSIYGQAVLDHWAPEVRLQTRHSLPDWRGGPAPVRPGCEPDLLGRPYGAGWVNEDFALRAACFISREFDLIGFYSVC